MHAHATPVPGMLGTAMALAVSAVGTLIAVVSPVFAQTGGEPSPVANLWVPGGAAAVAVGGLVYVAKQMASGKLVPVDVAEVMASTKRTAQEAVDLIAQGARREDTLRQLVVDNTAAMTANTGAVAELTRAIALQR